MLWVLGMGAGDLENDFDLDFSWDLLVSLGFSLKILKGTGDYSQFLCLFDFDCDFDLDCDLDFDCDLDLEVGIGSGVCS